MHNGDVPTDQRFTGQRRDATIGLYDYNARWYDPALGRFVQPDPLVPDPGNPQALNRYTYVYNNPLRYTDPTGRCAESGLGGPLISVGCDESGIGRYSESGFISFYGGEAGPWPEDVKQFGVQVLVLVPGPDTVDDVLTLVTGCGIACQAGYEPAVGWFWRGVSGTMLFLPISGTIVRYGADELLSLSDDAGDIVYRVMRPDEHPAALVRGIWAKDPTRRVHPQRHVSHGQKEASNWISTTRDLDWARQWQKDVPIYAIDLRKVKSMIVDLTTSGTMEGWHPVPCRLAERASEVLVDTHIPAEAIVEIIP